MKTHITLVLLVGMLVLPLHNGMAQFRSDSESTLDRTGQIVRSNDSQDQTSLFGLKDFQMNHSYEISAGSFGGNMYNSNTYTNTMHLLFNENLYGRVDLSMSHSPFGNNLMGQNDQAQIYVRNAELNYNFNDNARIQLRFQQLPAGHGYGYGYHSPFQRRNNFYDPHRRW